MILSPFFLLFFCFFFLLTIFTLIQWIRRVEMVLSYHSICLLRFSRLVILLYRNIQTHLILLRLRSHTIVLLPFPSHTVTLIRSSSLSLAHNSRAFSFRAYKLVFLCYFSLFLSQSLALSHSYAGRRVTPNDRFFLLLPLTRNFRLIEKKNEEKRKITPSSRSRKSLSLYT